MHSIQARQDDPDNTISKSDIMGEFGKDWTKVKWDAVGKGAATASASKKRKLETEEQEQVEVKQEEQTPMELLKQVCIRMVWCCNEAQTYSHKAVFTQAGTAIENLKKLLPDMGDNKKVLNENKMLKKKLKEAKEELDSLKKTLASLASGST